MPMGPLNPKEFGHHLAIAQIGMEMVVPIGIGLALDYYLGWGPWATVGGALFGLVGGLLHLITLVNRQEANSSKPQQDRR